MRKKKYSSRERERVIKEMEQLLAKLNGHIGSLRKANALLKKIDADSALMEKYYCEEWAADYEHFDRAGTSYQILLQDPVHNALHELHTEKVNLLKQIVRKLQ